MITKDDVRSIQAERFLAERGLDFEGPIKVPLDQIDVDTSRRNQARIIPIIEHVVQRYLASFRIGAILPAAILGLNSHNNKLTYADGNHRDQALREMGAQYIWAYVFKYESYEQFETVSSMANSQLNGAEATLEERLIHASRCVDRGELTQGEAAALWGVSKYQLQIFRSAQAARQKFDEMGIGSRAYEGISDGFLSQIQGVFADNAIRVALRLAKSGIKQTSILDVGREAGKGAHSESKRAEQQIQKLLELEKIYKNPMKKLVTERRAKRDTFYMRLKATVKLLQQIEEAGQRDKYQEELALIHKLSRQ